MSSGNPDVRLKTAMAALSVLKAAVGLAARINPLKRVNPSAELLSRAVVRSEQGKVLLMRHKMINT